jgi:hypothetical protein
VPHQASCSGGASLCVANSDRNLPKSAVQTRSLPPALKQATNWPLGATAMRAMGPPEMPWSVAESASTSITVSPVATKTCRSVLFLTRERVYFSGNLLVVACVQRK